MTFKLLAQNRILGTALVFLATSAVLVGQELLSVRVMALSSGNMPELYFSTPGEKAMTPVDWSHRQPSKSLDVRYDGSVLQLFRIEVGNDGSEKTTPYSSVKVQSDSGEILLFGWLNRGKLNLYALPDTFMTAKHTDWLFINLSSRTVFSKIGKDSKPFRLESGQSKTHQITLPENNSTVILCGAYLKGQNQVFYSSYLPAKTNRRTIMIFSDDGDKIRTKTVIDSFLRRVKPSGATSR